MKKIIPWICVLLAGNFPGAAQLQGIQVMTGGKANGFQFYFYPSEGPIPQFFQDYDPATRTYSIHFLKTTSDITLGTFSLPENPLDISKLVIEEDQRRNGEEIRNFLKVGVEILSGASPRLPAKKLGPGQLLLTLAETGEEPFEWSLDPSAPSDEARRFKMETQAAVPDRETQEAPDSAPPPPAPDVVKNYTVTGSQINMRSGPGTEFNAIGKLDRGVSLRRLGTQAGWSKMVSDNDTGYIREDLIMAKAPLPVSGPTDAAVPQIEPPKAETQMAVSENTQALEKKYTSEINELEDRLDEIKKIEEKARAEETEKLRKEYESRLQEEKKKSETAVAEMRKSHEETLEKLRQQNSFEVAKIKQSLEQKRNQLINTHKKELSKVKSSLLRPASHEIASANGETRSPPVSTGTRRGQKALYNPDGARDPFVPVRLGTLGDGFVEVDQMKLAGVIWHEKDPIAILEHRIEPGLSVTLRREDRVARGKVLDILRDQVTFEISEFGMLRTVVLKLASLDGGG